jgi:hypothetical protein
MSVSATHWSWPVMSDSRQPSIMERWGGLICAVAMLAVVAGDRMIGAGGSTAEIKSGLATLKDQNAQFAIRIDGLADRIEKGPRADQLQDIIRGMSQHAGRMDAYDNRIRELERLNAAGSVRLEAIEAASRAQLRR